MYLNELLIGRRIKLSEDLNVYYSIEGIHTPFNELERAYGKKRTFRDSIKKLFDKRVA